MAHVIFLQFQVDLVRVREVAMPGTLQHGGRLIRPERLILRLRPMSDAKRKDEPVAIGSFYPRALTPFHLLLSRDKAPSRCTTTSSTPGTVINRGVMRCIAKQP